MTNDEMKQMLIQKYEEMQRNFVGAHGRWPETDSGAHMWLFRNCLTQSQILNLDKETEYLLVAVCALEHNKELVNKIRQHLLNFMPPSTNIFGIDMASGPDLTSVWAWPPA